MPTPFYHLSLAEEILGHPGLPRDLATWLAGYHDEFLFGNTAPDVQMVSGQRREETHFFCLPLQVEEEPAWIQLLSAYPGLTKPEELSGAQAAFVAGYLCHLQADWMWIRQIFTPVFGLRCQWQTFPERIYLHNVLRTYLDIQILAGLNHRIGERIASTNPQGWLPFVQDDHLMRWRDLLVEQLQPGAHIRTVDVFAARQGISPAAFYELVESEARMDEAVFTHLPRHTLKTYRQELIGANHILLQAYFGR